MLNSTKLTEKELKQIANTSDSIKVIQIIFSNTDKNFWNK